MGANNNNKNVDGYLNERGKQRKLKRARTSTLKKKSNKRKT